MPRAGGLRQMRVGERSTWQENEARGLEEHLTGISRLNQGMLWGVRSLCCRSHLWQHGRQRCVLPHAALRVEWVCGQEEPW